MRASPLLTVAAVPSLCLSVAVGCGGCSSARSFSYSSAYTMREEARREEVLALEVATDGRLTLDPGAGDVRVEVVPESSAELTATLVANAPDAATAEQVLERYRIEVEHADGGLCVRALGEPLELREEGLRMQLAARVRFDVRLPGLEALVVRTGSGAIEVVGPVATADLESGYGNVRVRGVRGELRVDTSSGSIEIEEVVRGPVELESGYGSIGLRDVDASVRARTNSGRIAACDVRGELELSSGYGELEIERSEAAVVARTSSGKITLTDARGGPWELHSGYGPVEVRRLAGELGVETKSGAISIEDFEGSARAESGYGSVAIAGILKGALSAVTSSGKVDVEARTGSAAGRWTLRSGYGQVELSVPEAFACDLEASTGYGDFESEFTLVMEAGRHGAKQVRASLGGGGPTVELRTTSGDVYLKKSAP